MTVEHAGVAVQALATERPKRSLVDAIVGFARNQPLGAAASIVLLIQILMALLAPLIAPYDPLEMHLDNKLEAPGTTFLLGTDELGRDVLSRVIHGSRISLFVALTSVAGAKTIALMLGLFSGYFGGKTDLAVQRLVDIWMGFPVLIFMLGIVSVLGPGLPNVTIAIAMTTWPSTTRVVRSRVLAVKEMQYVEAARSIGCGHMRIMFRHIMPQTVAPLLIMATAAFGAAILSEASLSFLGLGTPPPAPSWGGMLSGVGRAYLRTAPWLSLFPGIALTLSVLAFNLFGDAARDVLDPRLRRR